MVSSGLESSAPIHWDSPLAESLFTPNILLPSLSHVETSKKFDVVLLSVSNLQSFQNVCAQLEPLLHSSSIIAVESTGYVQLEPFVLSNFSRAKGLIVCSIMNESEVKRLPHTNTFSHRVLNGDQRIYLGTCTDQSKSLNRVSESDQYAKLYKLLQMVQADSHSHISLLKSNNHKEFMTYQWKLALPRIVLNPLSVIFEEPYPENLRKQILAKPLVTGLVNELFKIIKKMECKLIKGFENEASICKNWSAHYPQSQEPSDPIYLDTNPTFYNMYYGFDMELDLLLLQPILLGDDHDVRTPYLENLYSIMCQVQTWSNSDKNIFFSRQIAGSENSRKDLQSLSSELAALRLEKEETENSHRERISLLKQLDATIMQKRESQDQIIKEIQDRSSQLEMNLRQLSDEQSIKSNELRELDAIIADRHARLAELDHKLSQMNSTLTSLERSAPASNGRDMSHSPDEHNSSPPQDTKKPEINDPIVDSNSTQDSSKIQALQTPDMSDLSDIAVYGAALNGDMQTPRNSNSTSQMGFSQQQSQNPQQPDQQQQSQQNFQANSQNGPQLSVLELKEKELELQRRERALLDRERNISVVSYPSVGEQYNEHGDPNFQMQAYNNAMNYNQMNGGQRQTYSLTGNNPYMDGGHQPDGYQGNGYFPHNMAPNMRNNPRYHQGGQAFNQGPPQLSRRGSQGNMQNLTYQHPMQGMGHQPQMQIPPQQMQRYNGQPHMQGMPNSKLQSVGSQHFMMNQGTQGNIAGFPQKKPNRRSAFPDQALNIDYGGRGGMAMTNAGPKARNGNHPSPNIAQSRKSTMGFPSASNTSNGGLRPPTQNGSSNSSGSGQSTPNSSTPEPYNEVRVDVPVVAAGAPLGSIASDTQPKEKKKRGFLKKS